MRLEPFLRRHAVDAFVVLLAAVWFGGPWFTALVAVAGALAVWELLRLAQAAHARGGAAAAWAACGLLLIGTPLCYYLALRALPDGAAWVLLALLTVFANDTAAYATGRLVGSHRMAPAISPGKTWEGAAGGVTAAVIACVALSRLLNLSTSAVFIPLGAGIAIAAQAGDLFESALKRRAGVKDASGLLPGHGGVLDRLDSLVLTAPLVYHGAQWIVTQGT